MPGKRKKKRTNEVSLQNVTGSASAPRPRTPARNTRPERMQPDLLDDLPQKLSKVGSVLQKLSKKPERTPRPSKPKRKR